ncbi:MAG: PEGA domain-containing protein [Myxococcota bacterium]
MTRPPITVLFVLAAYALPAPAFAQQPEPSPDPTGAPSTTSGAIEVAEDAVAARPEGAPAAPSTILQVIASPTDATIKRGEDVIGTGSARVTLKPGSHPITVERAGYKTIVETVIISEASPESIILRTHLSELPPPAVEVGREGGAIERLGSTGRSAVGWSALGVGTALVGASVALSFATRVPDGCGVAAPEQCEGVRDATGLVAASGIVGGASVLAGIALLAWDGLAGRPLSVGMAPGKRSMAARIMFSW